MPEYSFTPACTPHATVLIVDDEPRNCVLLQVHLEGEGYRVLTASDGPSAILEANRSSPDLILLDVMMPGMSGIEAAETLKSAAATRAIPIIMVTALQDRESKLLALRSGAEEFLAKPIDRAELLVRVRNLLRVKEYQDFLADGSRVLEAQVMDRTRELTSSYREAIFTLVRAAEYKDEETGAHVQRISHYVVELAEQMGMDPTFKDEIFHAAPMHDVGKIGIPDSILLKAGALDASEWDHMKTHTVIGARVLSNASSPYLRMGADIALCHHERWDGSGYPRGISKEQIPLPARVMTICDVYDALRSKRPYKTPFSHARALEVLTHGDGRTSPDHFDPSVLSAFQASAPRLEQIYEELVR